MKLVFDIARTHVLSRMRQTLVGMLGVAMGVGFSVMMAILPPVTPTLWLVLSNPVSGSMTLPPRITRS